MLLKLVIPVFLAFFLISCQTLSGLQSDMNALFNQESAPEEQSAARHVANAENAPCPKFSVVPELSQMIEFKDISKPSAQNEMARLNISDAQSTCSIKDGQLVMDIEFTFDGKLGPKARVKKTDRPSFAFPYFVAVTGPKGSVLSKEIFAASMSYEPDEETLQIKETITQYMPLDEDGNLPSYKVMAGFQLASEQLAYNREHMTLASGAP